VTKAKRSFDFHEDERVYFRTRGQRYLPVVVKKVNIEARSVEGVVYEEDGVTPIAALVWPFKSVYKEIDLIKVLEDKIKELDEQTSTPRNLINVDDLQFYDIKVGKLIMAEQILEMLQMELPRNSI
jgi:hypothetical protein